MKKTQLVVAVDDATIEALRQMAVRRGLISKTGPGARTNRGNISQLLMVLALEATAVVPAEEQK